METKDEIVVLKGISISHIKFDIIGDSPLIVNQYKIREDDSGPGNRKVKDRQLKFNEQFENSIYINDDGSYGFPASGIKKGIVRAATYNNNKKLNMKFLSGALFVTGECNYGERLKLVADEPIKRIDAVKPPQGKGITIEICRAQFTEWKTTFFVEFNDNVIDKETIADLIIIAGYHCGLGEMRPEKGYGMGRYSIVGKKLEVKDVKL